MFRTASWKFTLRMLLGIIAITGAACAILTQSQQVIVVPTRRSLDFAIVGSGYRSATELYGGRRIYTRQLRLHIDSNGEPCVHHGNTDVRSMRVCIRPNGPARTLLRMHGLEAQG